MKVLKNIIVVYRDNDLFQEMVPEIVSILRSSGREVEVKVFSLEMKQGSIVSWLNENTEVLAGKIFLSDKTSRLPMDLVKNLSSSGLEVSIFDLDTLIYASSQGNIMPSAFYGLSSLSAYGDFFTHIVKQIFKNTTNMPDRVVIFTSNIADHTPELQEVSDGYMANIEIAKILQHSLIDGGIGADKINICEEKIRDMFAPKTINKAPESAVQALTQVVAKTLSDGCMETDSARIATLIVNEAVDFENPYWRESSDGINKAIEKFVADAIIDGGTSIEEITMQRVAKADAENQALSFFLEDIDTPNTWLIVDRHADVLSKRVKSATVLTIPEGNFLSSCKKAGLLPTEDGEFQNNLEKILKEQFS